MDPESIVGARLKGFETPTRLRRHPPVLGGEDEEEWDGHEQTESSEVTRPVAEGPRERQAQTPAADAAGHPDDSAWHLPAHVAFASEPPPVRWLVDRLWAAGAVGFIGGEPKVGKGWMVCELGVCIPSGEPVLGEFEVPEPGPTLLIAEEDALDDLHRRIGPICKGKGIGVPRDLHVSVGSGVLLDDIDWQQRLVKAALELGVRAILLDPLVRMHVGDESSARDMSRVLGFLRRLRYETNAAVIVAHHSPKPNETNRGWRPGQRLRGSGDFYAVLDSGLFLTRAVGSLDVSVAVEHRSRPAPPPFSFQLPADDSDEIILGFTPGGAIDAAASDKLPDVIRFVAEKGEYGVCAREVREGVTGGAKAIDEALKLGLARGELVCASERRPDKLGRERVQKVWRLTKRSE